MLVAIVLKKTKKLCQDNNHCPLQRYYYTWSRTVSLSTVAMVMFDPEGQGKYSCSELYGEVPPEMGTLEFQSVLTRAVWALEDYEELNKF